MLLYNCRLYLYKVFKKTNVYCMSLFRSTVRQKILKPLKEPLNIDPVYYLNTLFDSSAKPFLDISRIHLLDKFFEPGSGLKHTYNFVINESVAKDIVDKIFIHSDSRERIFIEGNPGVGLITINLINHNAAHICVFENSELQHLSLTQILKKYSNAVTQIHGNLNKDSKLILRSFDNAKTNNLTATFILVATSYYFIRLMVSLFLKYGLWETDFEIYMVLSDTIHKSLVNYTPKNFKFLPYCAFNLLFVIEEIANYPTSAFLPLCKNSDHNMNFIKVSKNFKSYIKEDELIYYVAFIDILGRKSTNFIIPTLEKWLPDCGPNLISKGISMTNQVRDLSFEESIALFKCFQKCEGFDNFKSHTSKIFEETHSTP